MIYVVLIAECDKCGGEWELSLPKGLYPTPSKILEKLRGDAPDWSIDAGRVLCGHCYGDELEGGTG